MNSSKSLSYSVQPDPIAAFSAYGLHSVQFYEDDAFLIDAVSDFIGTGLKAGEAAVVIATRPHLDSLTRQLKTTGLDVLGTPYRKHFLPLDATETLSKFMVDGSPDERRFTDEIGGLLKRVGNGRSGIRAFGEMVALLWAEGNSRAALQLEGLWNDLQKRHSFSLLCAYPLRAFGEAGDRSDFGRVCSAHTESLPTEEYTALPNPHDRLRVISELQQQAKALKDETLRRKHTEERYRHLFGLVPVALYSVDQDGVLQDYNARAAELWGRHPQIGEKIHRVPNVPGVSLIENLMADLLSQGITVADREAMIERPDGSRITVLVNIVPMIDSAGRISGAVSCFQDITGHKETEHKLESLLAREQQGRTAAESANRMKDEFVASVSHELRTPLNGILGWANLLAADKLEGEKKSHALQAICRNAMIQAHLVNDLLDMSSMVMGKFHLHRQPMSLIATIEGAMDSVYSAAQGKGVELRADLNEEDGQFLGDADRLHQVMWNLLSNAIKFTPAGGMVTIGLNRKPEQVEIIVRDTGEGIEPDFLPYVFDRFRQADGSIRRRHSGLGIGLAIVRHVVEMHGGSVFASSEGLGHGTSFSVRLPLTGSPGEKCTPSPSRRGREDESGMPEDKPVDLTGVGVLVVDDEEDTRDIIATLLTQRGAEVRVAGLAREAYAILEHWRPDVILSDIGMPEEDGYTFLRNLRSRSQEKGGQIPAAAITAYTKTEDRMRALRAGFQSHVPKPINLEELIIVVASLAGKF